MSAYPKPCDNCERITSDRVDCADCGSPVAVCGRCAGEPVHCADCACGPGHDCRSTGCDDDCEACCE